MEKKPHKTKQYIGWSKAPGIQKHLICGRQGILRATGDLPGAKGGCVLSLRYAGLEYLKPTKLILHQTLIHLTTTMCKKLQ